MCVKLFKTNIYVQNKNKMMKFMRRACRLSSSTQIKFMTQKMSKAKKNITAFEMQLSNNILYISSNL